MKKSDILVNIIRYFHLEWSVDKIILVIWAINSNILCHISSSDVYNNDFADRSCLSYQEDIIFSASQVDC